ncbi:MAG: ABC transporter ATP-binding protein [Alphaproteobacteria bacterium]|nr:ABC transporter ATP-binding protein [Alphaproteobacteria bacterium]
MDTLRKIARLRCYLSDIWLQMALCGVCLLLSPVLSAALLSLVESLIDTVFVSGRMETLNYFLAGYVALVLGKFLVDRLEERSQLQGTRRIIIRLKADLYGKALKLPPGAMPNLGVGQILSRLSGDTKQAEFLVFSGLLGATANVVRILVYVVFLYSLSATLTLMAVLAVPLLAVTSLQGSAKLRDAYDRISRSDGSTSALAEERLSAKAMVQAFGREETETALYQHKCLEGARAELTAWTLQAGLGGVFELISIVAAVLLIGFGAHEVKNHAMSVGALVAYLGSLGYVYDPAKNLANTWAKLQRAAAGAERSLAILDLADPIVEAPAPMPLSRPKGILEFRDVCFGYKPGRELLKGVSFRIEAGENVAIVGNSGAGKTTLLKLALRFYDPTAGQVLLDGIDLRDLRLADVRGNMAVVLQDANIFRGTVGENIAYGNPEAPEARLAMAARTAQVEQFIATHPDGFKAQTGPRGGNLSGGQRQRVALARALMRDAPILLLDEATASLDGETEEAIQNALANIAGAKTIITIAHRLASVRRADRIIVIEDGTVIETGTPLRLLNTNSRCREIFASQLNTLQASA